MIARIPTLPELVIDRTGELARSRRRYAACLFLAYLLGLASGVALIGVCL